PRAPCAAGTDTRRARSGDRRDTAPPRESHGHDVPGSGRIPRPRWMAAMTRTSEHVEWLNLIDRSGPFVVPAVLEEVFPQGFEKVETPRAQRLRAAYDEWRDAVDEGDPELAELHAAWVRMVIRDALEYEDFVLASRAELRDAIAYRAPEHG